MPELVIMIGLPGSGKTTFAKENYPNHTIISSDAMRKELYGDENDQSHNNDLFNEIHARIRSELESEHDVVFDATNINRKRRITLLREYLKNVEFKATACVMATSVDRCIRDDKKRERQVGEAVIRRMRSGFNPASYWEGFDRIYYVVDMDQSLVDFYKKTNVYTFRQFNHWHTKSLGFHQDAVRNYVMEKAPDDVNLALAAQIHDMGKIKTQSFKDKEGNTTEEAHYYNHQHVGAYDMMVVMCMSGEYHKDDVTDIINLIDLHMDPLFVWPKSPKTLEMVRKYAGDGYVKRLELLSEADKAGA